ncbi:hypothetical protein ACLESD_22755 [Pyxidicoccus sp. 3LFB2]
MKRSMVVMAVFLGLSLVGCGGAVSEAEEAEAAPVSGEASTVSQFATCYAACSGGQTVSCSGTSCSSTDFQGVTCNGVFTPCPAPPTCGSGIPECSAIANTRCFTENATQACCSGGFTTELYCSRAGTRLLWLY